MRGNGNEHAVSVQKTGKQRRREIKVRGENNKSRTSIDSRLKGASFTLLLKKCVPPCSREQKMRLEWLIQSRD